jgi:hypothetical protein
MCYAHRTSSPRGAALTLEILEDRLVPTLLGNNLFPADNPWNQKVTNAPVAANSASLVAAIGTTAHLHPDFGTTWNGALNGIPYNVVTGSQPGVSVTIDAWPGESDLVPIPIPSNAIIEGDPLPSAQNTTDRHLIVFDQDNNIVYETFNTQKPSETTDHQWHADAEAVWDLNKNTFRTAGNTSADAAGLPILPGLVRADEVLDQGVITHALRFTVNASQNTYVYPASHEAGSSNTSLPPMGARFRLKASFDISSYSATDRVILQALKDYGMIVADNGSSWYLSGAPSSRWDDNDLHALNNVPGSAFEAVDLTPVVSGLSQTQGALTGGTTVVITGSNFLGGAGQTQVFFGGTAAPFVNVMSDTQIVVTAPGHVAGTVAVTVRSPYGTSAQVTADSFTYSAAPTVNGTLNQRFVALLYREILQRGAGTSEVAGWAGLLDQGTPRSQIVQAFENSQEHLGILVDGLFSKLLGRPANANERPYFIGLLQTGTTVEQISQTLATSLEFNNNHSSNISFVQAVFVKVLGREASASDAAAWASAVPSLGRGGLVSTFLGSLEFRAAAIAQMYGYTPAPAVAPTSLFARLLRRTMSPAQSEINGWAGTSLDLASIEKLFAGSYEFYVGA